MRKPELLGLDNTASHFEEGHGLRNQIFMFYDRCIEINNLSQDDYDTRHHSLISSNEVVNMYLTQQC